MVVLSLKTFENVFNKVNNYKIEVIVYTRLLKYTYILQWYNIIVIDCCIHAWTYKGEHKLVHKYFMGS